MKIENNQRSAERLAELEEGCSVTAGLLNVEPFYRKVENTKARTQAQEGYLGVFSRLVNVARRNEGLSIEDLAKRADIDALELFQIEDNLDEAPEPRVVSALAKALRLPAGKLMQLVGHVSVLDPSVSGAAYRFAASSGSMQKLSREEKYALGEFVKALTED